MSGIGESALSTERRKPQRLGGAVEHRQVLHADDRDVILSVERHDDPLAVMAGPVHQLSESLPRGLRGDLLTDCALAFDLLANHRPVTVERVATVPTGQTIAQMIPERKGQIERAPTGEDVKRIRQDLEWRQEDIAQALRVSLSTVKRWEKGDPIVKDRDIEAIRHLMNGEAAVVVDQTTPGDEVQHIVGRVRALATRFNVRRDQHAPADELGRLRRELVVAVANGLEAADGDESFQLIVEAIVGLLTSEGTTVKKSDSHKRRL